MTLNTHKLIEHDPNRRAAALALGFDPDWLAELLARPLSTTSAGQRVGLGDLDAQEARLVIKLLPQQVRSARGVTPTSMINAALHRARTGTSKWRGAVPPRFGDPDLLRQRFGRWMSAGIWTALLDGVRTSCLSAERKAEFELVRAMVLAETRRTQERHE